MLREIYAKSSGVDGERLDSSLDPFYLFINLNSKDEEINTADNRDLTLEEIGTIRKVKFDLVFSDSLFTSSGIFFEARDTRKPSVIFKFFYPSNTQPFAIIDRDEVMDLPTGGLDLHGGLIVCIPSNPDQIDIIEGRFTL